MGSWVILACAAAEADPSVVGTVGSDRFWHDQPVSDVHVEEGGTLLTLAGCEVYRWRADGALVERSRLGGCTDGLNNGFFSGDGAWVAAAGLWVGESGVWRATGGPRVHALESLLGTQFCGDALWSTDAEGFARLDLHTGALTHPVGDHGTGFLCVDDQWIHDDHGHRIDLDGTLTEHPEEDGGSGVGTTGDGRALVYRYGGRVEVVDRDGRAGSGIAVPDTVEVVRPLDGGFLVLQDSDDVAWHVGADGRIAGGPYYAENGGLDARRGDGAVFVWNGAPWGFAGRRVYPLGPAVGPVDSLYERFFFDADELYVCHGSICEARALGDLGGVVRVVRLPDRFDDEAKLSPTSRYLGQYDTERVYRVTLDSAAVDALPVPEWPDGIGIDDRGHPRWRLSSDEDDDEVYVTRVFERVDGKEAELGRWTERELSDPGATVLQLGPTVRWAGGQVDQRKDADDWFESWTGAVVLALPYGAGIDVLASPGQVSAHSAAQVDTLGPWGDGLWVSEGQKVRFLGPDLTERARLTVPWKLDEVLALEGAGSPDGRWFAARRPDGYLVVWRVGDGVSLPPPPTPDPEPTPWTLPTKVGTQLGAPPWHVPEAPLFEDGALNDLPEADLLVVAMATFAPRTMAERLARLEAIRNVHRDTDELYLLHEEWRALQRGGTFLDAEGEDRPPDAAAVQRGLAKEVSKRKLRKATKAIAAWQAKRPAPEGPAFGLAGCHAAADEASLTVATPPSALGGSEVVGAGIIVRVAADGTPRWEATLAETRGDVARSCWQAHDRPWTPARDGEQRQVPMCVLVWCTPLGE